MANFVLPIVARTRRGFPAWVDDQIAVDHKIVLASDASINATTKGNLLLFGSRDNVWSYFPIASDLSVNNIEVLIKLSKSSLGNDSFVNTGGAIMLSPTKDTGIDDGYALCLGSGTSSACSIYDRPLSGSQKQLGAVVITPSIASTSAVILVRIRRDNDNIRMKVWHDGSSEPPDWSISTKNTTYNVSNIGFVIHGKDLIINLKNISYATNGDTASFDLPPVVDVMAGTVTNVKNGDIINIHDLATHNIVDSIVLPSSGAWLSNLYNDRPVYAKVERASGSEYDLLFAKYGGVYLGGDYPDGSVKDNGVPSAAEVSVLYRSDDPILGGATIAKVVAPPSGEWRVSGLPPNVPFDVVARKPNRKDVVVSNVIGIPDPDFKFALLTQLSNNNGYLTGLVFAKGAAQPITASFLGTTPYGLQASALVVDGNKINANIPLRDYGDFSFDILVTDANSKTVDSRVNIIAGKRAPFVDLIAYIDPVQEGSASTSNMVITIPSSVAIDDLIMIAVLRRSTSKPVITDDNQGVWTRAVSSPETGMSYDQWNDIYWRHAKAGDAGKLVTIPKSNGLLVASMSVFRGKYAKLTVKSAYSFKDRYNSTYAHAIKELAPITHNSGFLVRAITNVYASNTSTTAFMKINNMTNLGPTVAATSRMQVGTIHLGSPGIFGGTTYETNVGNAADAVPDIAVIIDEIRP